MISLICKRCSTENQHDAIYCKKCGVELNKEYYCEECGKKLEDEEYFCTQCGIGRSNEEIDELLKNKYGWKYNLAVGVVVACVFVLAFYLMGII